VKESLYILAVLCMIAVAGDWLGRQRFARLIGSALCVLLLGIVLANAGVIPTGTAAPPLYLAIVSVGAPVSIFLLLLDVHLGALKRAGLPMLLAFAIGAVGTLVGIVTAFRLTDAEAWLGQFAAPVAGMYAATYIGGSANFNALAVHYGVVSQPALFAGANVVDAVVGGLWLVALVVIGQLLCRRIGQEAEATAGPVPRPPTDARQVTVGGVAILIALAFGAHWLSVSAAHWLGALGFAAPAILIVTTLALLVAHIPAVQRMGGARLLGTYAAYLFLVVIGAFCDFESLLALGRIGGLLVLFVAIAILTHGVIVFAGGRLAGLPPDMMAIASSANVGGATTIMPVASGVHRMDLLLPGILVGMLGNAVGTYAGFLIAWLLSG
jgi:uncharacterized membrane protein